MVEHVTDQEAARLLIPAPTTFLELQTRVPLLLHCMIGPPMAYFDIPVGQVRSDPDATPYERYIYEFIGVQRSLPREGCEADLVAKMWEPFAAARLHGLRLLFWRRPLYIESFTHAHEETGFVITRIGCRVVIPGFKLAEWHAPWSQNLGVPK